MCTLTLIARPRLLDTCTRSVSGIASPQSSFLLVSTDRESMPAYASPFRSRRCFSSVLQGGSRVGYVLGPFPSPVSIHTDFKAPEWLDGLFVGTRQNLGYGKTPMSSDSQVQISCFYFWCKMFRDRVSYSWDSHSSACMTRCRTFFPVCIYLTMPVMQEL